MKDENLKEGPRWMKESGAAEAVVFEMLQAETGVEAESPSSTEGRRKVPITRGRTMRLRRRGQMIGLHASSKLQEPAHQMKDKTRTKHTKRQQKRAYILVRVNS